MGINKNKIVIFLRNKIDGQNSIEEIAATLKDNIPNTIIKVLPSNGRNLQGIIKNIFFGIKNQGYINHFICPSDIYVALFITGKKIVTWHDIGTLEKSSTKFKRLIRKILTIYPAKFIKNHTFISEFTKIEVLNKLQFLRKKNLKVIHNPLNKNFKYTPKSNLSDPPIIFHPGTAKRKNLLSLIEGIKELNVKINIVGILSPEQRDALNNNNINYTNEYDITIDQIIERYKECDIVSFPTSYEGFGMPVIEAQAIGRPVITSEIEPIPEVSGNAVKYIDYKNPESIKNAIVQLLEDRDLRYNLIQEGLKNALNFKSNIICRIYQNYYSSL